VYEDEIPDLWHSLHHKQLQVLALTERCPGCLAACSDVDSFGGKDGAEVVYAPPKGHAAAATSGEPSGAA
jgi:hypothetical protein